MFDDLKWWLVGGLTLLLIIIIVMVVYKKRIKIKESIEFPELLEALGGKENISNIMLNGSRINFNFDSKKSLDKEKIKENGVETIVVSNKKATLVIGRQAPIIYKYLAESIKA